MRTLSAVIAAALGVGLLAPTPALAKAPNLGPDWELVGTRKVKNWVPHPTKAGSGKWELVDYNTYRIFQENLSNPAPDMPALLKPEIQLGPIKKGKAFDEAREIERVRRGLLIHKYQTIVNITPQTRTETTIQKGWKLTAFTKNEARSRALRTKYGLYDISFQVPVQNFRWDVVELGRSQRELTLDPIEVARIIELLPPERTSDVGSLATANTNRPGVFRGDSGSGGKATLQAAKLRQQMGANEVKASDLVLTPEEIEEARRKAEEEALKRYEEESRQKAEEEAKRKAEREELARLEQERIAAEQAAAEEAAKAEKMVQYRVDAKKNVVHENQLKKQDAIKASVGGLTLEKNRIYYVTATGLAKYGDKVWDTTPDNQHAHRFKVLLTKGNAVKVVAPYGQGQGLAINGTDYEGHTLRFVFEDDHVGDNVQGTGWDVTVTSRYVAAMPQQQPNANANDKAQKNFLLRLIDSLFF